MLVASFALPDLLDIDTLSRRPWADEVLVPPLRGYLDVKPWLSTPTVRVVVFGLLAWLLLPRLARTAPWWLLLPACLALLGCIATWALPQAMQQYRYAPIPATPATPAASTDSVKP